MTGQPPTPRSRPAAGLPAVLVGLAVCGAVLVLLPLVGLVARVRWADVAGELGSPEVRAALRLSLLSSLGALALSAGLGVPLAWVLSRLQFPGRSLLRAAATLPLVLPPVVAGVALLAAFGRRGFPGAWLYETLGVRLPFSTAGVVLAETFVAMPFLVVAAEAGLSQLDRRYEEVAATLGAGPWTTFRRVTVPLAAPSLAAGAALCWARALGEFGATITFAGNFPGRTQTAPLAVYLALETRPQGALALSLLLVVVSLAVLVALRGRWFRPA